LAVALAGTGAFNPIVNGMIATGVESGKLHTILLKLAEQAEFDAQTSIERAAKIIPGLIYGCLVVWIALQIVLLGSQYVSSLNSFMP
jgi:type II secretory pathway component PulF